MNAILLILFIFALIIFIWQLSNLISILAGSLYVKTNSDLINFALKKANLKRGDIFYDLGCGNGDVVIAAAKMGASSIGYEISPFYFILSKLRTYHNPKIKIKFQNIKDIDLKKTDVVYCYLLPKFLAKLKNKFLREHPGKIISIGFAIPNLPNKKLYQYKNHKIYIYSLSSRST